MGKRLKDLQREDDVFVVINKDIVPFTFISFWKDLSGNGEAMSLESGGKMYSCMLTKSDLEYDHALADFHEARTKVTDEHNRFINFVFTSKEQAELSILKDKKERLTNELKEYLKENTNTGKLQHENEMAQIYINTEKLQDDINKVQSQIDKINKQEEEQGLYEKPLSKVKEGELIYIVKCEDDNISLTCPTLKRTFSQEKENTTTLYYAGGQVSIFKKDFISKTQAQIIDAESVENYVISNSKNAYEFIKTTIENKVADHKGIIDRLSATLEQYGKMLK